MVGGVCIKCAYTVRSEFKLLQVFFSVLGREPRTIDLPGKEMNPGP